MFYLGLLFRENLCHYERQKEALKPHVSGKLKMARPKTGVTVYKENPFNSQLLHEVEVGQKHITMGSEEVFSARTGELTGVAAMKKVVEVDSSQFMKVFVRHTAAFFELGKAAQAVLQVIFVLASQSHGRAEVYLNWPIAEEVIQKLEIACGKTKYYRGLKELIEKKFLAESTRTNIYFTNPTLFFNGDRALYVREIRKVDSDPTLDKKSVPLLEESAA